MEKKQKKPVKGILELQKQLELLVCTPIHFVNMLKKVRLKALQHLPDKRDLIDKIWKNLLILLYLLKKYKKMIKSIIYMPEFQVKNKWMTLNDKLITLNKDDQNTVHIQLLAILLQELILKEKDLKPFWTPVYKELSEKLLSPIEIDCVDLDSNSLILSSKKVEVKSSFLTTTSKKVQNMNYQKTYYQLSTSTVVNKWEKEVINQDNNHLKSLKIKLKPRDVQKKMFNEWFNTTNYIYNKTIETIKNGHKKNPISLRNLLVTDETRTKNILYNVNLKKLKELNNDKIILEKKINEKNKRINSDFLFIKEQLINDMIKDLKTKQKNIPLEKNNNINTWELKTPKNIREGAVNDVCKSYKTGFTNLKNGNIKFFNIKYRKNNKQEKSFLISKDMIKNKNGIIEIAPSYFKKEGISCKFKMGKRTIKKNKDLKINNDCRIVKQCENYYLIVPVPMIFEEKKTPLNYCGIDPGVRTFMTCFNNNGYSEYDYDINYLKKLDNKISLLKNKRINKRIKKRKLSKIERKKDHLIDQLHWITINDLLKKNDILFYGDIKSHDVVKNGKYKTLNRDMNNLKFFKFKQRLIFKAFEKQKMIFEVKEPYTTKTCSFCGVLNNPGKSKIYECHSCNKKMGRDINASKNMLLKGIINYL